MLGELHPFGRHAVDVGRQNALLAVTANVALPQIITQDKDYVHRLLLFGQHRRGHQKARTHCQEKRSVDFHKKGEFISGLW